MPELMFDFQIICSFFTYVNFEWLYKKKLDFYIIDSVMFKQFEDENCLIDVKKVGCQ